jgi:hypothetical protein
MLSSHLRLCLPVVSFLQTSPPKPFMHFSFNMKYNVPGSNPKASHPQPLHSQFLYCSIAAGGLTVFCLLPYLALKSPNNIAISSFCTHSDHKHRCSKTKRSADLTFCSLSLVKNPHKTHFVSTTRSGPSMLFGSNNPHSQNNIKLTNKKFKGSFDASRTNITLNYVKGFSPYRAVNTIRLCYINQSVK